MLLKSLLQVSERYESTNLLTALPSSFLEPLLSFTLMEEPEIRLLVLSILTSLIDRHHNAARLSDVRSGDQRAPFLVPGLFCQSHDVPSTGESQSLHGSEARVCVCVCVCVFSVTFDVSDLELKDDACCRQDNLFIRKVGKALSDPTLTSAPLELGLVSVQHAQRLYRHVYLACREESSGRSHYRALVTLLAVLGVELANEEVLVDLIRLVLALQVIALRQKDAPHLLPDHVFSEEPRYEGELEADDAFLFSQSEMCEALTGSSFSVHVERFNTPYTPELTGGTRPLVISSQSDCDKLTELSSCVRVCVCVCVCVCVR
ncbi:unnamed protein product [Tetraodon nigroviridis]|uniref:(spotted green pufferfish) hypothetical protein n=1 Tax=Tetraodon nigroviridis TaxID=99883 RepID=Q4T0R3_TETNG|nr:unnamed protein product [Tetraodon nigroviridis]